MRRDNQSLKPGAEFGSFRLSSGRRYEPSLPAIFPDQLAPVIRIAEGGREMLNMRWDMRLLPIYGGAHGPT